MSYRDGLKERRLRFAAGITALAIAALATWAFWPAAAKRADPLDARQVALGESLYRKQCARCHGAQLEGQPDWRSRKTDGKLPAPPHDGTGHTWHHSDEQLFQITKLGLVPPLAPEGYKTDMPAFGPALADEQILAILAFIKSHWPPEIQERQDHLNRRASTTR
jgi:mono/diheme cytochrome c family protein